MTPIQYNVNNLKQFITDLRIVRKHYRIALFFPFLYIKTILSVDRGFCNIFHVLNWQSIIKTNFIAGTEPRITMYAFAVKHHKRKSADIGWWFKVELIRPRLKVLNQTIKYYESVYKERFGN